MFKSVKKRHVIRDICDGLVVLLNLSNPYTIIPIILFTPHIGVNSAIIAGITLLYLIIRIGKNIQFSNDVLLCFFIVMNIYNILNCIREGVLGVGYVALFVSSTLFYLLLYNLCIKRTNVNNSFEENLSTLSQGYNYLCYYSLLVVIVMLVLTEFLNFNPLVNDVTGTWDILEDNSKRSDYYFPLHMSLLMTGEDMIRLPFFHTYGTITGIFHEPHTMTYYIVPFFFLMFGIIKNRRLLLVMTITMVVYMLVAASATNIMFFLLTLVIWLCLQNKVATPFFIALLLLFLSYIQLVDNPIVGLVLNRLESSSMSYSTDVISYAVSPKTLLGNNFYDLSYLEKSTPTTDIGFIIFLLNILFVSILFIRILKLCFAGGAFRYVGLFGLYFMLHSAKVALNAYSLEILMFVIFVVTYSLKTYKKNGNHEFSY